MNWTASVDAYCERLGPEFWAEPLNAVTNAAFFVAAFVAWRSVRRHGGPDVGVGVLLVVLTLIGTGSFLFHTVATRWAALADTAPIGVFILTYLFLALRRFAGFERIVAAAGTGLFLALAALGAPLLHAAVGPAVQGFETYLFALLALLVVGASLVAAGRTGPGKALLAGAALFAVSLSFRAADAPLCAAFPNGTHFVWHMLNAALLCHLIVAMVRYGRPR